MTKKSKKHYLMNFIQETVQETKKHIHVLHFFLLWIRVRVLLIERSLTLQVCLLIKSEQ